MTKLDDKDVGAIINRQKGITLIALVITIVVLIILAGVGINLTIGENGILTRARNAQMTSDENTVKEKIETAVVQVQIEEMTTQGTLTLQKIYERLALKDSNVLLNEYSEEDEELTGTYTLEGKIYNFTMNQNFEVIVGDAEEIGPVQVGGMVWNEDGTISVELLTELTGTIEYQVNGTDGTWKTGELPTNLQVGDKLYVRVNDGETATEVQEIEIKDTIKPEEFTISVPEDSITYQALTISSTGTEDKQTGIRDYSFIVTKDGEVVQEITEQEVTEYKIEALVEETEYVVYMLAYDNAGNERKSNVIIVKTASKPITSDMYGKAVNYSANGVTSWKLFYSEVAGNFYLISTTTIPANKIPTAATGITATGTTTYWSTAPSYLEVTQELRDKFMFTWNKGQSNPNIKCVSRLLSISAWASFANGTSGNTNITESCAIGGPTIEMFVESWNILHTSKKITLTTDAYGYYYSRNDLRNGNSMYLCGKNYWLASPTKCTISSYYYPGGIISYNTSSKSLGCPYYTNTGGMGIRPVVYIPNTYKLKWNSETSMYDIVEK